MNESRTQFSVQITTQTQTHTLQLAGTWRRSRRNRLGFGLLSSDARGWHGARNKTPTGQSVKARAKANSEARGAVPLRETTRAARLTWRPAAALLLMTPTLRLLLLFYGACNTYDLVV